MRLWPLVAACLAVGCVQAPRHLNAEVRTVAVLMPFDMTNVLDAGETMWPLVFDAASGRGYELIPMDRVKGFYEARRFHVSGEINQYTPEELAREFACDGILYSNVVEFNRAQVNLSPTASRVAVEAWLIEGKTGRELWRGRANRGTSSLFLELAILAAIAVSGGRGDTETFDQSCRSAAGRCLGQLPLQGYDPVED